MDESVFTMMRICCRYVDFQIEALIVLKSRKSTHKNSFGQGKVPEKVKLHETGGTYTSKHILKQQFLRHGASLFVAYI